MDYWNGPLEWTTGAVAAFTLFIWVSEFAGLERLEWTTGMDHWHGPLEWTTGMDHWNGPLEWTTGMDHWNGPLER